MSTRLDSQQPRANLRSPGSSRPVPIVALDFATARDALGFVERLPEADYYKVGLQLFTAAGPDIVRMLRDRGSRVFLDLKFHDIPNTVAGAVRSAAGLGVDLLTVHAAGGTAMLRAAAAAARSVESPPLVFAVTVLTSLSGHDLADVLGKSPVDSADEAVRYAALAGESGLDGVVTSVHEVDAIRRATGDRLAVLTPGIRPTGAETGDQARVATPADAARAGVDYIVIGRPVTLAPDPRAAYRAILDEIRTAHQSAER